MPREGCRSSGREDHLSLLFLQRRRKSHAARVTQQGQLVQHDRPKAECSIWDSAAPQVWVYLAATHPFEFTISDVQMIRSCSICQSCVPFVNSGFSPIRHLGKEHLAASSVKNT